MRFNGIDATVKSIDAAYLVDAFSCIKQIIENIDNEINEGWNVDALKEKIMYEDGEFDFIINDIIDLAENTTEENKMTIEKIELCEDDSQELSCLIVYFRKAVGIINPNELDSFFYEHMRNKLSLRQAFVSSSIEITQILSALEDILEVIQDDEEITDEMVDEMNQQKDDNE